jgi:aarF domain-containing kinase
MEFIDAPKISEVQHIEALNLDPKEVAKALCEVFGEMIFCHGFVHCDPHPGNIFVRRLPGCSSDAPKAQLVLLDHGLYRQLDEDFRRTYCELWRAMLVRDSKLLQQCGEKLNVGPYAKYLPLLFTYRSIRSTSPLATSLTEEERKRWREDLQQLKFSNVGGSLSLVFFLFLETAS